MPKEQSSIDATIGDRSSQRTDDANNRETEAHDISSQEPQIADANAPIIQDKLDAETGNEGDRLSSSASFDEKVESEGVSAASPDEIGVDPSSSDRATNDPRSQTLEDERSLNENRVSDTSPPHGDVNEQETSTSESESSELANTSNDSDSVPAAQSTDLQDNVIDSDPPTAEEHPSTSNDDDANAVDEQTQRASNDPREIRRQQLQAQADSN